jgi:hypothetical protein
LSEISYFDAVCHLLDQDELSVRSEDQVFDAISSYCRSPQNQLTPEQRDEVWSTCRFVLLSDEYCMHAKNVSEIPEFWLNLGLEKRKSDGEKSTTGKRKRSTEGNNDPANRSKTPKLAGSNSSGDQTIGNKQPSAEIVRMVLNDPSVASSLMESMPTKFSSSLMLKRLGPRRPVNLCYCFVFFRVLFFSFEIFFFSCILLWFDCEPPSCASIFFPYFFFIIMTLYMSCKYNMYYFFLSFLFPVHQKND